MLQVHKGKPKTKKNKENAKTGTEENANKKGGAREGKEGEEGWWGQREGSQKTTYGSDSVITANL